MKILNNNIPKYLGVILLLYVLVAGFLVPLKPGVSSFYPKSVELNEVTTFSITTYNTFHTQSAEVKVWVRLDSTTLLSATEVRVLDDNQLQADIVLGTTQTQMYDLEKALSVIIDNEIDGYMIYPSAILVKPSKGATERPILGSIGRLSDVRSVEAFRFPYRSILYETIRNTFFHVAIWFAMFLLLIYSCYHSIRYLRTKDLHSDRKSEALINVALFFGIAGILTGAIWARFTWGTFWTSDIKLNMSAVAMLVYCAYWVLRSSISDIDTKARISAVYNIFAFINLMFLVMVIPRFTDSLHPGNGGNPALGGEDLDSTLRCIFYPAIIGYTLIGLWMADLNYRFLNLQDKYEIS